MMKSLETKLKKENLVEKFNNQVKDFMKRGVIKWASEIPGINEMQKSYIPLTFTLKMILKLPQNCVFVEIVPSRQENQCR